MFSINVILVIHSREKLVWQLNIRQIDAYFKDCKKWLTIRESTRVF